MKEMIEYYYGLDIGKIIYKDNIYYIDEINKKIKYILKKLNYDIQIDENLLNQLSKYYYFSKLVRNINNEYITIISDKKYVLLKENIYDNYKICLYDIKVNYYLNDVMAYDKKNNWIELWERKVDNFEKMIILKKEQYNSLLPIFNYLIGISENAILYLKKINPNIEINRNRLVASHKRLDVATTLSEYYDPLNIISDYVSRDVSEYVKSKIFNDCFEIEELKEYLNQVKLSEFEIMLLFARLLLPTMFFDYFENAAIDKIKTAALEEKIVKYEEWLSEISKFLYGRYGIEQVEWIIKRTNSFV